MFTCIPQCSLIGEKIQVLMAEWSHQAKKASSPQPMKGVTCATELKRKWPIYG
jgi:hypothetical protein